jgi:hypothetical protein
MVCSVNGSASSIMPFSAILLVSALALTFTTFYVLKQRLRLPESWRFLTKGREMLLERAKKVCLF